MRYLKSSIGIRILDSIGVVSNDMPDIRNNSFLLPIDFRNFSIFSGKISIEDGDVIFIYGERDDNKYMMSLLNGKAGVYRLYIVSMDLVNESPDLNNIFLGITDSDVEKYRELSFLEAGSFLVSFELIRNHISNWYPYKPTNKETNLFFDFLDKIKTE